jgi:hypothetical protein
VTISLVAEDNITKDMVDDWASAVGACSNAGLLETRTSSSWFLPNDGNILTYDEKGTDAVFAFQSQRNPRLIQYVRVPEFDASLYNSSGILLTQGEVPLIISRTLAILNKHDVLESDPSYVFIHAYLTDKNRRKFAFTPAGTGTDIEEPTLVGDPGRGPASEL